MTSPFHLGSSGLPEPTSPTTATAQSPRGRFPPYSSIVAGPGAASNFYSHPARTSILNSSGDLNIGDNSFGGLTRDNIDMDPSTDDSKMSRERRGTMPSFSRAFNMLMASEAAQKHVQHHNDDFFVPSYLSGSTYVQKLEEEHRSKLQAQESNRTSSNGGSANLTTFNPHQNLLPPGAHRGMTHTVIERPPPFEEEDSLPPLPSKWNKDDQWSGIEIQADGLSVKYTAPKSLFEREQEACAVRANHYMPAQCGIYYYEVTILAAKPDDATIGIGFSTKGPTLSRPIGWEPETWGYHGDDGRCFTGQNNGRHYGPTYNAGDVIGCGVNFRDNSAFFTKNGVKIGTAFQDVVRGKLYPAISLKQPTEYVRTNFGQSAFVYNIDDMMKEEREKIQKEIEATETSNLVPGMNETDLAQALVLQFLQHDGYVETARGFAEEIQAQKQALNLDPDVTIDGINIKDDEDANNRQRIRRAILEGDIDLALKYTNTYYPAVLEHNEQVYFRLRCRRFIEMVREAAQMRLVSDKTNGHAHQAMDLDINGGENPGYGVENDGSEYPDELHDLEANMLLYGQTLQAEYANDQRREIQKALMDIWSLVAYPNPLNEPQVSHLLDKKGRVAVAEELNSAILLSLGKSSRAALETLYAQTAVLLDDLRQDGGEGAFVSIDDVMEGVPRSTQL